MWKLLIFLFNMNNKSVEKKILQTDYKIFQMTGNW